MRPEPLSSSRYKGRESALWVGRSGHARRGRPPSIKPHRLPSSKPKLQAKRQRYLNHQRNSRPNVRRKPLSTLRTGLITTAARCMCIAGHAAHRALARSLSSSRKRRSFYWLECGMRWVSFWRTAGSFWAARIMLLYSSTERPWSVTAFCNAAFASSVRRCLSDAGAAEILPS